MGSKISKKRRHEVPGYEDPEQLASETPFTVSEVEALRELYKKLSSSVVDDGFIQKEELAFALFRSTNKKSLFADRLFHLFDVKRNGRIDFGEFVRTLSIFHPRTPVSKKVAAAFKLYDLRHTGFIEREELKEMVLALLSESDLTLSEDIVEAIVDKTFKEADGNEDGKIDEAEWIEYATKNPLLLRNMTLLYLTDITMTFPSFVANSEIEDTKLAG